MAFNTSTGDPVAFSSELAWGNTFHRSSPQPLDRSSLFMSYIDAERYAKNDSTDKDQRELCGSSYPGQIITVLENGTPSVYVIKGIEPATRTLVPLMGVGSSGASTQTTGGECCCVWIMNTASVDQTLGNDDVWFFNDGSEKSEHTSLDYTGTTVTDGTLVGARRYVPVHTEDQYTDGSSKWINGHWSDWTLVKSGSAETEIPADQGEQDGKWKVDGYISDDDYEDLHTATAMQMHKNDDPTKKAVAYRTWVLES